MKKRKTNFYRSRKRNYNLDLKKVIDVFPKEAFDSYFENDHITVSFAIYSELLEVLEPRKSMLTFEMSMARQKNRSYQEHVSNFSAGIFRRK